MLFLWTAFSHAGWARRVAEATPGLKGLAHVAFAFQASLVAYAVASLFASVAYLWYLYYAAGFAVCLHQLVLRAVDREPRVPVGKEKRA